MSVNRATVRRRERCGQHDGVTDGKVTQCAVDLWCDTSENRSQCTRGYTRTSCSEDLADAPSSLLALCRDKRLQCGVHAQTEEVCAEPRVEATCQEERYGDCEEPSKVCDARRQLSKHTWVTYWKMLGSGGHGGTVHLQQSGRRCEDVSTRVARVIGPEDQYESCLTGWDSAPQSRAWRLSTLRVVSSTQGWCRTLFQVDTWRQPLRPR